MAFIAADLLLVHSSEPQIFKYKTNDIVGLLTVSGYFNPATARLSKGDIILASADRTANPTPASLLVTSATGAATVTVAALATPQERISLTVSVPAIGTAGTQYVLSPMAGRVTRVSGVSHANGAGSGGTSTITVSVPTTGVIASLPFVQGYVAGDAVNAGSITAHLALSVDGKITIATDGAGSHTAAAELTIVITPG